MPATTGSFSYLFLELMCRYGTGMTIHIPTTLSNGEVAEFKAMYLRKYGIDLSDAEARDTALRLIQFVGLVIKDNPDFLDDPNRS